MPDFASLPVDWEDPQWLTAAALILIAVLLAGFLAFTTAQLGRLSGEIKRAVDMLRSSHDSHRRETTIEAVRRYETDPQLRESIKHIYQKTVQGTDYSLLDASDRFHVLTLLNYFDGIACGIEQGILLEALVKDYLQVVLDKNVCALLRGQSGPTWVAAQPIVDPDSYGVLLALHQRWQNTSNSTLYEMLR